MLTIIFDEFTQPPLTTFPPLAFLPIEKQFYHDMSQEKAEMFKRREKQKERRSRNHLWQGISEKKIIVVEGDGKVKGKEKGLRFITETI